MCDENDGWFCSLNQKFKNFRNVLLKGEWWKLGKEKPAWKYRFTSVCNLHS